MSQIIKKITDKGKPLIDNTKNFLTNGEWYSQVILAILLFIVFVLVSNLIINLIESLKSKNDGSPWLYKDGDTKDATKGVQVSQRGKGKHTIPILRSTNQLDGIEFSYVFWMHIDNWSYHFGKWKHIIHKGNDNSWPSRAPGVWLHPKENKLRVYMNTFSSIAKSYVDIDNIPINKWFHVGITLSGRYMDVYINSNLKRRMVLDGIPRQNYGDFYINKFGGFSGDMSAIRYFNRCLPPVELEYIVSKGIHWN